jgi:hypothetical protein
MYLRGLTVVVAVVVVVVGVAVVVVVVVLVVAVVVVVVVIVVVVVVVVVVVLLPVGVVVVVVVVVEAVAVAAAVTATAMVNPVMTTLMINDVLFLGDQPLSPLWPPIPARYGGWRTLSLGQGLGHWMPDSFMQPLQSVALRGWRQSAMDWCSWRRKKQVCHCWIPHCWIPHCWIPHCWTGSRKCWWAPQKWSLHPYLECNMISKHTNNRKHIKTYIKVHQLISPNLKNNIYIYNLNVNII